MKPSVLDVAAGFGRVMDVGGLTEDSPGLPLSPGISPSPSPSGGILDAVGRTPLVQLTRYPLRGDVDVWAKIEASNPAGSAKDRSALRIIQDAWAAGQIDSGTTVIESSSGNMGVALAQTCRYLGIGFTCVVDERACEANLKIMKAFGAEIEMVANRDLEGRDPLVARLERVASLVAAIPNSFWPNQYENLSGSSAHRDGTVKEIFDALDGEVDYLLVGTSTGGTIRGCTEYLAAQGSHCRVIAVDAWGSALFGGQTHARRLPGLGAGFETPLSLDLAPNRVMRVSEPECVAGCRKLVKYEAILAGASSGGVMSALEKLAGDISPGSRCVVILADSGTRYLDTVYDDEWVASAYGADE